MAENMTSDEGKSGKDIGMKANMAAAKSKVGSKKEDMAGRMKPKGMPYTMSTQSGSFDQSRGQKSKMWGPEHNFARGGGMPYKQWGPDGSTHGSKKSS